MPTPSVRRSVAWPVAHLPLKITLQVNAPSRSAPSMLHALPPLEIVADPLFSGSQDDPKTPPTACVIVEVLVAGSGSGHPAVGGPRLLRMAAGTLLVDAFASRSRIATLPALWADARARASARSSTPACSVSLQAFGNVALAAEVASLPPVGRTEDRTHRGIADDDAVPLVAGLRRAVGIGRSSTSKPVAPAGGSARV